MGILILVFDTQWLQPSTIFFAYHKILSMIFIEIGLEKKHKEE